MDAHVSPKDIVRVRLSSKVQFLNRTKMIKNIINVILILLVIVLTGIACSQTATIEAYNRYNRDCEILLDSIASWDKSFFDTVVETDAYYDYINSREILDYLLWNY